MLHALADGAFARGRSGGSTAPAAGPSTASPARSTTCSPCSPTHTGSSATATRGRMTGPASTSTCEVASPPRSSRRGSADRRVLLPLWPVPLHGRGRRRAGRSGGHARPDQRGGLRAERSDHPWHRRLRPHTATPAGRGRRAPGPEISFSRSNLTVAWDPAFPSLLELAEACDVPVRWSCRSGVCHTCETGLVSGTVTYLPDPVEDAGPGNAYLCCSQPQSDLVLDL